MNQKTIISPVSLSGIGLHSGLKSTITLKPAAVNSGICFIRTDQVHKPLIRVCSQTAVMDKQVTRCTAIEDHGVRVYTIEHLLAAIVGCGIDNVVVEIDNEEVPGLDGSSLEFLKIIKKAGIENQDAVKKIIKIKNPISVSSGDAQILVLPADEFTVSYTLDYDHPQLQKQYFSTTVTEEIFTREIAPSRTFCLEREVPLIKAKGLGKGANESNTLVMGDQGPIGNQLRFPNECCRHKVLDIVGDLFLLGATIQGHVMGYKSGHNLNRQLVHKIMEQNSMNGKTYDINDIMKILPHRYPFLLVDRVIEIEPGKKGIGIKNVTINDGFFQGHFPSKPVMPGVLMVEAMAQTAGVVVLTSGAHPDKVALFMSIDSVKFRKVVIPGDQLVMEVEIIRDRERTSQVKGVAKVDGEIVVEADMLFSYTESKYLNA